MNTTFKIKEGPFGATVDSLKNYVCPDWFRDAKFGIWSHWGPQSVPMYGDWYARHMYTEGHAQYCPRVSAITQLRMIPAFPRTAGFSCACARKPDRESAIKTTGIDRIVGLCPEVTPPGQ